MVRAYHLLLTTYGFWLPNDPRGSWSKWIRAWELLRYGQATTTTQRRSLARDSHDWRKRREAKTALARCPVSFTGIQARAAARGFAEYCRASGCVGHACSIMAEHVHLVVARHRYSIEQVANLLKGAATRRLIEEQRHPFADQPYRNGSLPTPWARKCWKVFLYNQADVRRVVRYVEANPLKEGKKRQAWGFVRPLG